MRGHKLELSEKLEYENVIEGVMEFIKRQAGDNIADIKFQYLCLKFHETIEKIKNLLLGIDNRYDENFQFYDNQLCMLLLGASKGVLRIGIDHPGEEKEESLW